MSKRQIKSESRKNRILDAAEQLFTNHGYEKTTVSQVSKVAGVAHGLCYHYFPSKEGILDAVIDRYLQGFLRYATEVSDYFQLTATQKIAVIMQAAGNSKQQWSSVGEWVHQPENTMLHCRLVQQGIDHFSPLFAKIIAEGNQNGEFSVSDYQGTARFILGGWIVASHSDNSRESILARIELVERALNAETGHLLSELTKLAQHKSRRL